MTRLTISSWRRDLSFNSVLSRQGRHGLTPGRDLLIHLAPTRSSSSFEFFSLSRDHQTNRAMEQSNESAPAEQISQEDARKHRHSDSLGLTAAEDQMPASSVKPVLPTSDPKRKASKPILKSEPLSPVPATNISASKANVKGGSPGPGSVAYAPSYSLLGAQGVGPQGPLEPLKRVTRACDMCHARKTKVSLASNLLVPLRACTDHPYSLPELAAPFSTFHVLRYTYQTD